MRPARTVVASMTAHPARPRRSEPEQQALHAALVDLFERRITFNQVLGIEVVSLDPACPRVRFAMRPELVGHYSYGQLHGGVTAAVLDAAGGFALMIGICEKFSDEGAEQVMARFSRMGTIDLRIDYLRRGLGRTFEASALVTRLGGRLGSVQMRLESDDGTLIATGAAAYVIG